VTDKIYPTVIALDYDNTVTRDIEFWLGFIAQARARQHKVYLVTMRYPSEIFPKPENSKFHPIDGRVLSAVDAVYCTSRKAKRAHMLDNGIKVTVWIDDHPEAIYKDGHEIWPNVTPEGEVQHLIHD
jgi:hypothetical protein